MTRIMVLGGLGFIGSHVVDLLHRNKSNQIFIFDDESTGTLNNIRHLISEKFNTRVHVELKDVRNKTHLAECFGCFEPEVVVLLAAQAAISKSLADPRYDLDVNVGGMLNTISAAKFFNARRIIFSSTSAVYRERRWGKLRETDPCEPISPYGISKLAAEHYLRSQFPESVILRFGNVFGPRQTPIGENQVIPRAIRHFKFGDDFQVFGDGKQTRDYVYVEDVAEAVEAAIVGKPGTYNVATGRRRSVNDVVDTLAQLYDVPGYKWEHRAESDPRKDICLDVHCAEDGLGWRAQTSFAAGLKKTMEWWETDTPSDTTPVKVPLAYEMVR